MPLEAALGIVERTSGGVFDGPADGDLLEMTPVGKLGATLRKALTVGLLVGLLER